MFPKICTVGPFTIYSYGVMLAIAVVVCSILLGRDAKRMGLQAGTMYDLVFVAILSGIVGARIFFILLNLSYFSKYPQEIIMVQNGGLAFQGGLVFATLACVFFLKKKGILSLEVADLIAPYLALGQSIGRIGCFLNGCCHGKHADHGMFFPVHDDHLHPTQLYATVGLLIVFFSLKKLQTMNLPKGKIFVYYLILASSLRFVIQSFRADNQAVFLGLSVYHCVAIIIFLIAIYVNYRIDRQRRQS